MTSARVVIGSNFGDEGKGILTDALSTQGTLVVRFNGGAQAGHTVVTPDGQRHVFHHFGSGTFRGAQTHLSKYFIVNPMIYVREREELRNKFGIEPSMTVDPGARVTTPYDMILNQAAEKARGKNRHGSVGLGINETVERHNHSLFSFPVEFFRLSSDSGIRKILNTIRNEWVPIRCEELNLDLPKLERDLIESDVVLNNWVRDINTFLAKAMPVFDDKIIKHYRSDVVFEGAQGLLLDQKHGTLPYATRSHTGLTNVVKLAEEADVDELHVVYATRTYLTRHGAGPLPNECEKPYDTIVDETNIPHEYQGDLRFALLDVEAFGTRIRRDTMRDTKIAIIPTIGITCCDQVPVEFNWWKSENLQFGRLDEFFEDVQRATKIKDFMTSYGPTRRHITLTSGTYFINN